MGFPLTFGRTKAGKQHAPTCVDSTENSSGSTSSAGSAMPIVDKQSKFVWYCRITLLLFLLLLAGLLGWLSYSALSKGETKRFNERYEAMVAQALEATTLLTQNKLLGAKTMARVAGYTYPNASSWPFTVIPGYYDISETVAATSIVGGLILAPIVKPEQVAEFEEMAYNHYTQQFPGEEVAISSFGKGIWVMNETVGSDDGKYHDISGVTNFSSKVILTPKLQHSKGNHKLLMMNVHGYEKQGLLIDSVIDCAEGVRAKSERPEEISCQAVSDLIPPKDPTDIEGPGAYVATPIYPANDNTVVVGMIFAKMNWNEVLDGIFSGEVTGIDCVVQTEYSVFTYTVKDGITLFDGEGDKHDLRFDFYGRSAALLNQTQLTNDSVAYTITFYPNAELHDAYETNVPVIAAAGSVVIVLIASAIFVLYDYFVRNEFKAKRDLLTAKRHFVRYVSHEVRTPLNSVCMGLSLLQEEIATNLGFQSAEDLLLLNGGERSQPPEGSSSRDEEWFHLSHEILSNAQSAVDVLNDLLNYDKIESGTLSLELSVIPIWKLIQQTVGEFKLPAAAKKINVKLELPRGEGDIEESLSALSPHLVDQNVVGDAVRLTQVLRNLVSNGLKFTPEKGSLNIRAKWEKHQQKKGSTDKDFVLHNGREIRCPRSGELVVTIQDTGAGMTKEQLQKLFGHGVQFNVNELQGGKGSGLGLYIAKGIVEQHNGSLTADSAGLGYGTTFTMTLPLYNIAQKKADHHCSESQVDLCYKSAIEDQHLHILIVDDSATNRKLLRRLLCLKMHECDEAEDGKFAVEMVKTAAEKNRPYDLVLMDYEMPVMDGPTAASKIRSFGSDVFIIGVTGNMMAEDVDHFCECGANVVLPKPFKMASLEDICVEYNIGRREV